MVMRTILKIKFKYDDGIKMLQTGCKAFLVRFSKGWIQTHPIQQHRMSKKKKIKAFGGV